MQKNQDFLEYLTRSKTVSLVKRICTTQQKKIIQTPTLLVELDCTSEGVLGLPVLPEVEGGYPAPLKEDELQELYIYPLGLNVITQNMNNLVT